MRKFLLFTVAFFTFTLLTVSQEKSALTNIWQLDFRNFRYPWRTATSGDFQWLTKFDTTVSLQDGVHEFKVDDCARVHLGCPEVSISEVIYTDVNDDSVQDAIVVLRYVGGGTAFWDYVYIYTIANGKAKLMSAFQAGPRIHHGLHRVYVGNGHLIIELNEPDKNAGECCPTWRTRTEYQWRKDHFEAVSQPIKESIPVYQRDWYKHQDR